MLLHEGIHDDGPAGTLGQSGSQKCASCWECVRHYRSDVLKVTASTSQAVAGNPILCVDDAGILCGTALQCMQNAAPIRTENGGVIGDEAW